MTTSEKMKAVAPILLRIGLAIVFLWFGAQQLLHTQMWLGLIPKWVLGMSGLQAATLVHFNGAFEIVFGLCLLFGFFTRVVSLLLALHMIHITLTLIMASGVNAISIRDFGLSIAAVTLFLLGHHGCSVDSWLCTKYPPENSQNRG
jgi:uncharacterized membrane protein YphA (DoxX/SURF4 family)